MQSQGVVQPRQTPNIIQGPRRADHKPLSNVVVGRQPRRAGARAGCLAAGAQPQPGQPRMQGPGTCVQAVPAPSAC